MAGVAKKPIQGAQKVAQFALNLRRMAPKEVVTHLVEINGRPGFIIYIDGKPFNTLSFDVVAGRIVTIRAVVNPDKLSTLPPLDLDPDEKDLG